MENVTDLNRTLLILNNTSSVGENATEVSPFPVWTIVRATTCNFGILANFLVIFIILFSSLRTSVFMNLIMSLAISDSLYLMSVMNSQRGLFGQSSIGPSLLHCRVNMYFLYVSGIVSSWVTVLISLERYIAIFYPFKVHIYCTKKRTYLAIITLIMIVCIGCIPTFYSCNVKWLDQQPQCQTSGNNAFNDFIFKCTVLPFYSIVPFLFIAILNTLILRKVKDQNAFRSQGQHSNQNSSTYNSSLIVMMVCVCLIFAITSFPATFFVILSDSCKINSFAFCTLNDKWLYYVGFMLENINHGINFFLYCITGSVFRFALLNVFKCKKKPSPKKLFHQQIATAQNVL